MSSLIWNEGMSVGIDAIDNDHKKMLSIVSQIAEAIDNQCSVAILESTFDDLAFYTAVHFKREEELMRSIQYHDFVPHQQDHQAFIDKIPELKKQLLQSESVEIAEQISQFLYDWLVDHILIADIDYVQTFHRKQIEKKSVTSLFKYISNWFSYRIKLSQRVFITAVLPIIGILLLSFVAIKDNYLEYRNMQLLSDLTKVVYQVNSLTHSLQIERGLLSGYISSDFSRFSHALADRQKKTDDEINSYTALLKEQITSFSDVQLLQFVELAQKDIVQLTDVRTQMLQPNIAVDTMLSAYDQIIMQLLSRVRGLVHIEMNSQFTNNITAISAVVGLKEIIGQQRAVGTKLIEQELTQNGQYQEMLILIGRQLNAIDVFNYSASPQQQQICAELCNANEQQAFIYPTFIKLISSHDPAQTSQIWFNLLTEKLDGFKIVADQMIDKLEHQTSVQLDEFQDKFYFMLTLLSSIIILYILLFTVLNHSIINPIRRITHALKQITLGHYNQQVYDCFARDEFGAMYSAYETLRRKLLQADISKNIIKQQRKSLLHRKKERDRYRELASKDTLTGALNRRKFDCELKREINFSVQDGHALSLLLLDIDHFKGINDQHGHGVGDQVLRYFYQACLQSVKSSDIVARIGGEEFAVLMPETDSLQAYIIAERIRSKVSELKIKHNHHEVTLTVSIGVAQWSESHCADADEFTATADKALYQAKHSGRNCVVVDAAAVTVTETVPIAKIEA